MVVKITLTSTGSDSGPFDIYSNSTGSFVLIASGINKVDIVAGYTISVPDGTTIVRVQSIGECTNYQDIPVQTTTTTVAPPACTEYTVSTTSGSGQSYSYTACDGTASGGAIGGAGGYDADTFCAQTGTVTLLGSELTLTANLACTVEPTTTVAPTTQPPGELCFYYDAVVAVNDLQNSQDGNVYFVYTDCNGVQQTNIQSNEGTWTNAFCATGFVGTYFINTNNQQVTGLSTADYTGQACGNV